MKTRTTQLTIAILTIILLGSSKSLSQEGYKSRSFNVNKGGKLDVRLDIGEIIIRTWDKNEVYIKYEEWDEDGELKITQKGSTIEIESGSFYEGSDIEITVPSQFNLDLNTNGGNIDIINNISGKVECTTSGGEITTKDINGEADLSTAGGNINTGNIKGNADVSTGGGNMSIGMIDGEANISTGGGNIVIGKVTKSLDISTGGGNISTHDVGGSTRISTGGGNVSVGNISGSASVSTGGGNISLDGSSGETKVSTGGGDVALNNVRGIVKVSSGAGDLTVKFLSVSSGENKISSGYGDIKIYLPEDAKVTVSVRIRNLGWVSDEEDIKENIESDFKASSIDVSERRGEIKATYTLNGGGADIKVETSAGRVEIRKLRK